MCTQPLCTIYMHRYYILYITSAFTQSSFTAHFSYIFRVSVLWSAWKWLESAKMFYHSRWENVRRMHPNLFRYSFMWRKQHRSRKENLSTYRIWFFSRFLQILNFKLKKMIGKNRMPFSIGFLIKQYFIYDRILTRFLVSANHPLVLIYF